MSKYIDIHYRIILRNNRFVVQSFHTHFDKVFKDERAKYCPDKFGSVCTIKGDFGKLEEAELYAKELIEKNSYEIVLEF